MRRGVYFLADDAILDQVIGFLNSFRSYNPTIPLCLVPFSDDSAGVRSLSGRYGFTVWRGDRVLRYCDAISRAFHDGATRGHYRKLACWSGRFDEFLYIDADTVVLEPVDFVFDYLDRYDFLLSHSNIPHIRQWVWRESIYEVGVLSREQIEFAANTGFVASRSSLINPVQVYDNRATPLALQPHMELFCQEQPLLNYLIVTSGRSYASLSAIAEATENPHIPQEQWAGHDIGRVVAGRLVPSRVERVLLVHWAGEWQRAYATGGRIPYYELWHYYRSMGEPARLRRSTEPTRTATVP